MEQIEKKKRKKFVLIIISIANCSQQSGWTLVVVDCFCCHCLFKFSVLLVCLCNQIIGENIQSKKKEFFFLDKIQKIFSCFLNIYMKRLGSTLSNSE